MRCKGVHSFVWQDAPGDDVDGIAGWLVKAANGNGHTAPGGFDFRANARKWASSRGPDRVHGWTWIYYTTDGATAARELVDSLPDAPSYGGDVEGDDQRNGSPVPPALDLAALAPRVRDFFAELARLRPRADRWFTSYPDRLQATAHGAPWDDLLAGAHYGIPQVYYSSQGARWSTIVDDHKGKPVVAAFSPGDWAGWHDLASTAMRQFGAVALWRFPDTRRLGDAVATLAKLAPEVDDVTSEEFKKLLSDPDVAKAIAHAVWLADDVVDDPTQGGAAHVTPSAALRAAMRDAGKAHSDVKALTDELPQTIADAVAKAATAGNVTLPDGFADTVAGDVLADITAKLGAAS